ncbi:MAG: alpha/beta fold hydrolase [Planctomycetes bacterium]|nr:alpha/beta fold hydrolase [Planctomycetota bacterium]
MAHWKERGVDLAAYHTDASADDVDEVRRALGIEQLILWGESYGTHLSLAYLRRHGLHVARAVLLRVEGPDHTLKLPGTTQRHLERLHQLVAADPSICAELPDLLGAVQGLLARLAAEPVRVVAPHEGGEESVVLGPFDLQYWLANALGLTFEMRDVPAAILAMTRGDWSTLGAWAIDARRGETGSAMALAMDCASGASAARLARIEAERRDPANLLGDAVNLPYPGACAPCGTPALGDGFRAAFQSEVPVLFVSGDLDARTPPENVDEIRAGFVCGAHVLVRNAGHEPIEMQSLEFRALLHDFLAGKPIASRTIELPAPRFGR